MQGDVASGLLCSLDRRLSLRDAVVTLPRTGTTEQSCAYAHFALVDDLFLILRSGHRRRGSRAADDIATGVRGRHLVRQAVPHRACAGSRGAWPPAVAPPASGGALRARPSAGRCAMPVRSSCRQRWLRSCRNPRRVGCALPTQQFVRHGYAVHNSRRIPRLPTSAYRVGATPAPRAAVDPYARPAPAGRCGCEEGAADRFRNSSRAIMARPPCSSRHARGFAGGADYTSPIGATFTGRRPAPNLCPIAAKSGMLPKPGRTASQAR